LKGSLSHPPNRAEKGLPSLVSGSWWAQNGLTTRTAFWTRHRACILGSAPRLHSGLGNPFFSATADRAYRSLPSAPLRFSVNLCVITLTTCSSKTQSCPPKKGSHYRT